MAHQNENENKCKKAGVSNLGVTIDADGGSAHCWVPAALLDQVNRKTVRETTNRLASDVVKVLRLHSDAELAEAGAEVREDTVVVSWATPLGLSRATLEEHGSTIVREIGKALNTRVDELLGGQDQNTASPESTESTESGHDGTKQFPLKEIFKNILDLLDDEGDEDDEDGCGCGCGYGCDYDDEDDEDDGDEDDCGCGCGGCDDENDFGCGCGDCGYDKDHEDDTLRGRAADDIATAVARVLMRTHGVPVPAVGRIEMELSFTGIEKISLSGEYDLSGRQIDEDLTLTQVDNEIAQAAAELVREHRLAEVGEAGMLSFTGSLTSGLGGPFGGQGIYRLR